MPGFLGSFPDRLRRGWITLFGPVFWYDLVRTARRSRVMLTRCAFALFLLAALLLVHARWLTENGQPLKHFFAGVALPPDQAADLASVFFVAVMGVQAAAVFLLTPAYLAGAIAHEKESRALELLLATDLRSREIVLGLAASRLAHLALVLLAGLPVLSLLQLLGGIDPEFLLAGYAFLGLTLAGQAGLSLLNSLYARTPHQAIFRTYLLAVAYLAPASLSWLLLWPSLGLAAFPSTASWTSPVTLQEGVEWLNIGNLGAVAVQLVQAVNRGASLSTLLPTALRHYAWFHGVLAVGCFLWVVARFRAVVSQAPISVRDTEQGGRSRSRRWTGSWDPPDVSDRPMVWKEIHLDAVPRRGLVGQLLVGVLVAVLCLPAVHLLYFFGRLVSTGPADRFGDALSLWVRGVTVLVSCYLFLKVAVHAAGSVSGERERQTLDGLLATPLDLKAILFAKWLGSLLSPRGAWYFLGLVWLFGVLSGGLHPLALPCALVGGLVFAGFFAGLGLWLSVTLRTSRQAVFAMLFCLGVLLTVSGWASYQLAGARLNPFEAYCLTPPLALRILAFSPGDYQDWASSQLGERVWLIALELALWSLAGFVFWVAANARFRKATGRLPVRRAEALLIGSDSAYAKSVSDASQKRGALRMLLRSVGNGCGLVLAAGFERSPWPWRIRRAVPILLPLFMLSGGYALLYLTDENRLQETIAEIDRLDPVWRLEDLEAKRKVVPEDQNAALQILKVAALRPAYWPGQEFDRAFDVFPPPARQLNEHQIKVLRTALAQAQSALSEARRLADMPAGCFDYPCTLQGPSRLFKVCQQSRGVAELLNHDARLRAQENDGDGALDACRGILYMARALGEELTFISMLVRQALQALAYGRLERSLALSQPTEPALAALQKLLEEEERQPMLLMTLRGERAIADMFLRAIQEGDARLMDLLEIPRWDRKGGLRLPTDQEVALLFSGSLSRQRAIFLQVCADLTEAAKSPAAQQGFGFTLPFTALLPSAVTRQWIPGLARILSTTPRHQALLRCTVVSVALDRHRLQHGDWPASLSALVPSRLAQVPVDPYDGQPLRYRRLSDGVVVYSVGPDRTDNGGKLDRNNSGAAGTDLGVQLWDVSQRRQPPLKPVTGPAPTPRQR